MINYLLGSDVVDVDVNARKSIIAIIYLAVVGPCVFILQPGFVQGLVEYYSFSEQQAGHIASTEMFGLAFTTVLLSFIATRFDWRRIMLVCTLICTAGNALSVAQADFNTLLILRFITGIGSGGLISLTFTMMGLTENPDRNFGYIIFWVLAYGALGLFAMPTAFQSIGMNGVLVFFSLFCASGLLFIRYLPASGADNVIKNENGFVYGPVLMVLALIALLAYNTAIGVAWAYMFLVGVEAGIAEQAVANALTISQFLGIAGAFLAVLLEKKLGRLIPLLIGILGSAFGIYLLINLSGYSPYLIGVCTFNFLWNLSMPYLLAMLADFDASGKMVIYGVSMQMLGYALGPLLAAELLDVVGYNGVNWIAVTLFVVSVIFMLPALLRQQALAAPADVLCSEVSPSSQYPN